MLEISLEGLHGPAQARADATPHYRRSMRGLAGNEVGAMGELVAMRYLDDHGVLFLDEGQVNHDLRTQYGTIDVKTKERTVAPRLHYGCTVPGYVGDAQKPDWYLFVSLLSDGSPGCGRFKRGWVLGTITHDEFHRSATHEKPGAVDLSNNWNPTIACLNVPVSALRPARPVVH